jgi:hypothetical protein
MTDKADMRRGRDTLQLDLNYRASPIAAEARSHPGKVQAGDRVPDATIIDPEGQTVRLFDLLRHPDFTLLAIGGAAISGALARPRMRVVEIDRGPGTWQDRAGELRASAGWKVIACC